MCERERGREREREERGRGDGERERREGQKTGEKSLSVVTVRSERKYCQQVNGHVCASAIVYDCVCSCMHGCMCVFVRVCVCVCACEHARIHGSTHHLQSSCD